MINFQANFSCWWLKYLLWEWHEVIVTEPQWPVNIALGSDSLPPGNESLPEIMLRGESTGNAENISSSKYDVIMIFYSALDGPKGAQIPVVLTSMIIKS